MPDLTRIDEATHFDFAFYAHRCQHSLWRMSSVWVALTAVLSRTRHATARRLTSRLSGSFHLRDRENDT
jgi:hypothetical protein